jgi:hypothetical protein
MSDDEAPTAPRAGETEGLPWGERGSEVGSYTSVDDPLGISTQAAR